MKLRKSWKAVCILLHAKNGKQIMTHQVNSVNTTPPPNENCMEGSTPNPLKSLMSNMTRHTFSKLFQLPTEYDVLVSIYKVFCVADLP